MSGEESALWTAFPFLFFCNLGQIPNLPKADTLGMSSNASKAE